MCEPVDTAVDLGWLPSRASDWLETSPDKLTGRPVVGRSHGVV